MNHAELLKAAEEMGAAGDNKDLSAPAYSFPEWMEGYEPPYKNRTLWHKALGLKPQEPQPPVVPLDKWPDVWSSDESAVNHFESLGFKDVQLTPDGDVFMLDPAGNRVLWFHETDTLHPTSMEWFNDVYGPDEKREKYPAELLKAAVEIVAKPRKSPPVHSWLTKKHKTEKSALLIAAQQMGISWHNH